LKFKLRVVNLKGFLLVALLFSTLALVCWETNSDIVVKCAPDVYQGDLILTGDDITVIEGRFDINGSVIVKENATLVLRNAVLNFTQERDSQFGMLFSDSADGNPRFVAENAVLATSNNYYMMIEFFGNSSASTNNLTVIGRPLLWFRDFSFGSLTDSSLYSATAYDNSTLKMSNCTLHILHAWEHTQVDIANCTIEEYVHLVVNSVDCSVNGLTSNEFVNYWNFGLNCSANIAPDGWASNFTLIDTEIAAWSFDVFGFSSFIVSNSELYGLWAVDFAVVYFYNSTVTDLWVYDNSLSCLYETQTQNLYSYGNSEIRCVNTTSSVYNVHEESELRLSWYLDCYVVDEVDQDVPSANVTVDYSNGTIANSGSTDLYAYLRLTLLEKVVNATGDYPVGNYTVEAAYDTYLTSTVVNMTENRQIILELPFVIQEFPSLFILSLLMIVTLLAIIIQKKNTATNRTNQNLK
jgi:hypothetical protein